MSRLCVACWPSRCSSCLPAPASDPSEQDPTTTAGARRRARRDAAHASGPSEGCEATTARRTRHHRGAADSGGIERSYQLLVPESYDGTRPYPIVFGLHALTVDYRIVPALSGFADMEPTYDFIGVSPSGRLDGATPYWNAAPASRQLRRRVPLRSARPPRGHPVHRHRGGSSRSGCPTERSSPRCSPAGFPSASLRSRRSPGSSTASRATARPCRSSPSTVHSTRSSRTEAEV